MPIVYLYEYIILTLVTTFTIMQYNRYRVKKVFQIEAKDYYISSKGTLVGVIAITFLIGLRPLDQIVFFGDSYNYYRFYQAIEGEAFQFSFLVDNLLWDNLFNFWASKKLGMTGLFLLADAIYFGCTYIACKKWFPHDVAVSYLVFLGAFSTYSYSFNGVKAGIAGAVFLVAIAYYEKKYISIPCVLISLGLHHSMQMPVAVYVITLFYKNPKLYFYGWLFCTLIAVFHISFFQNLFIGFTDETGRGYLGVTEGDDFGGAGGFRIDFLLYSAVPVWIGYKLVMKDKLKLSKEYMTLLRIYLCTNGIWLLCMYASYTNRIAYLSWFMYPFVLIYPFLKEDLRHSLTFRRNQYKIFSQIMLYHLVFTLFMELIFYKFIKA